MEMCNFRNIGHLISKREFSTLVFLLIYFLYISQIQRVKVNTFKISYDLFYLIW